MKTIAFLKSSALALLALFALSQTAGALTLPVTYNYLTASTIVQTPFNPDDTLFVDTLVTTEIGPLLQATVFTVGPDVTGVTAFAVWESTSASGATPRLVDVNIDVLDSNNVVVFTDTFQGVLAGFAHGTFAGPIAPGTYSLIATGDAVRTASLDISLTFIPEPGTFLMLLSGLGVLGITARRARA